MGLFQTLDESKYTGSRTFTISSAKALIILLILCLIIFGFVVFIIYATLQNDDTKNSGVIGGISWKFMEKVPGKLLGNFQVPNLNRGLHTYAVPLMLFAENRRRLCNALKREENVTKRSLVLLEGGANRHHFRYHTHLEISPFRQESYFVWTFGVEEPGFYGAIEIETCRSTLLTELTEYNHWNGRNYSVETLKRKYGVDDVQNKTDLRKFINETETELLLVLTTKHAFSRRTLVPPGRFFELQDIITINNETLGDVMTNLRLIKTALEQEVLRYVARSSVEAHKFLMGNIRPQIYEYQLESLFNHYTYFRRGCRLSAYTGIVGSGTNAAILHYGSADAPNNRQMKDGDLCLIDMGAEYFCYGADITRTIPANGKFSQKQKMIHNIVLNATRQAQMAAKPGVWWIHLVNEAQTSIIYGLREAGLVKGGGVNEMMEAGIGDIFMPHGLGHQLGLDVHDAEIWHKEILENATERIAPILGVERTRILQAGMYITIEPGCYFIDSLIQKAYKNETKAQYMVKSEIEKFRDFGGIRIEDDFIVTVNGVESFSSHLPTTVEEIEKFMADNKILV